jgi:hypothetical protein
MYPPAETFQASAFFSVSSQCIFHINHLTKRCSQPLAAVKSAFDFMKEFPIFATLALTSGG